jgi:4-hydroxy-3-methylbut-2-enyl diphosphate reductase
VTKVHVEVKRMHKAEMEIIMIGHAGHPEVEGTMGQVDSGMYLVESVADVASLEVRNPVALSYVSQTTLSVDETRDIIAALKQRFPSISSPKKDDICYATQNRQDAVKVLSDQCDIIVVVGSPNSSNSIACAKLPRCVGWMPIWWTMPLCSSQSGLKARRLA